MNAALGFYLALLVGVCRLLAAFVTGAELRAASQRRAECCNTSPESTERAVSFSCSEKAALNPGVCVGLRAAGFRRLRKESPNQRPASISSMSFFSSALTSALREVPLACARSDR